MKKIYLLAGFFILISSFRALANNNLADTFPVTLRQKFSDSHLPSAFYRWRTSQQINSLSHPAIIDLRPQSFLNAGNNYKLPLSWWPQAIQLNTTHSYGLSYALSGFASGFATGLSTTNNYYLKNTYNWEFNKNFYSWSSFLIGAGIGTVLGLKDPRQFR